MASRSLPVRRVFLFNPPTGLYRRDDRCQCTVEDQTVQIVFPPMDLTMMAACAERAGATCRIEDYPASGRTWAGYIEDIKAFKPDLLIMNATTATLAGDLEALRIAREHFPGVITAGKGETLIYEAADILQRHDAIDIVLPNEAEEAVEEFVRGVALPEIKGMHFRRSLLDELSLAPTPNCITPMRKAQASIHLLKREEREKGASAEAIAAAEAAAAEAAKLPPVLFTGRRTLQNALDDLPLPARHLLRNEIYRSPETGNPLAVIHGNRGCPSKCIYCPAGVLTDFSVRYRSIPSIIRELKECVETHKIREFLFHGDTFTLNKKWLIELCEAIVKEGLDIHWGCNSRVDTIDDERAQAMKKAGCWVVAFGIETGDEDMLVKMKKNATLDQARQAVACCKRNGLRVHSFFVIGLPWETWETLERTFQFAQELDPDFFDFNVATPLPGTELHEIAEREKLFGVDYDPSRANYATGAMRTFSGLTSIELAEWRRKHLLKMYMRPSYIARTLWRAGSPRVAANYIKAGRKRLGQLLKSRDTATSSSTPA